MNHHGVLYPLTTYSNFDFQHLLYPSFIFFLAETLMPIPDIVLFYSYVVQCASLKMTDLKKKKSNHYAPVTSFKINIFLGIVSVSSDTQLIIQYPQLPQKTGF